MSYTTNRKKSSRKSRRQSTKTPKTQLDKRKAYRAQLNRRSDKTRGA